MIDADLHGKLRRDAAAHERSEDLLTSTVFGLLRHLPVAVGLAALMRRAQPVRRHGDAILVGPADPAWIDLSAAASCEIRFWPWLGTYGQPDVLLVFRDRGGAPLHVVVVEAKLDAPKSGETDDAEAADDLLWPRDQLVRYWQGLLECGLSPGPLHCSVIYLTAHTAPPLSDLIDSVNSDRQGTMRLAWLSWCDVWHIARPLAKSEMDHPAAWDLVRLLAHRGYSSFCGFSAIAPSWIPAGGFWERRRWFFGQPAPVPAQPHFWEAQ